MSVTPKRLRFVHLVDQCRAGGMGRAPYKAVVHHLSQRSDVGHHADPPRGLHPSRAPDLASAPY